MSNILEYQVLSELLKKFPPPPSFEGAKIFPSRDVDADGAKWDILQNGRGIGELKSPDAPSKASALLVKEHKVSGFMSCGYNKQLGARILAWSRALGTEDTPYMEQAITQETEDLNRLIDFTAEKFRWELLMTHAITVAQTDVKFTYSAGVAGAHKPTAALLWSDPSTADPLTDLKTWKLLIEQDSGEPATDLYMNDTVLNYFLSNGIIRDLLKAQYGRELVAGEIPPKILSLDLHVYNAGYVASGVFYPYCTNTQILMLAKTPGFAEEQRGSNLVPAGDSFRKVVGKYAYSHTTKDPVKLNLVAGMEFLPVIKKVENIVTATIA